MEDKKRRGRGPRPSYNPTPQEIRRETAKIRESWDERTYCLRAGFSPREADRIMQWLPPFVSFQDVMSVAREQGIFVDVRSFNEDSNN
jgi:hypothetical protein